MTRHAHTLDMDECVAEMTTTALNAGCARQAIAYLEAALIARRDEFGVQVRRAGACPPTVYGT